MSRVIDQLEAVLRQNGPWTDVLTPVAETLLSLQERVIADRGGINAELKELNSRLQALFRLLGQAKAYLSLLQFENAEQARKIQEEIRRLSAEESRLRNIKEEKAGRISAKEAEITRLRAASQTLTTVDIPAKNTEIAGMEVDLSRLREELIGLRAEQTQDEVLLAAKRAEASALQTQIDNLAAAISPDQEKRDQLLVQLGGTPPDKTLETLREEREQQAGLLLQSTTKYQNTQDEINELREAVALSTRKREEDIAARDTVKSQLIETVYGKVVQTNDSPPQPMFTQQEVSNRVTGHLASLKAKNLEILATEAQIETLQEGVDFAKLKVAEEKKAKLVSEADEIKAAVRALVNPFVLITVVEALNFYLDRWEGLQKSIDEAEARLGDLNAEIQRLEGDQSPPPLQADPTLDNQVAYLELVEKLTPREAELSAKQGRKADLDKEIEQIEAAMANRRDELIPTKEEAILDKDAALVAAKQQHEEFYASLDKNSDEIADLLRQIFNQKKELDTEEVKILALEAEKEHQQRELDRSGTTPANYLKRRVTSVSVPIPAEQDRQPRQSFRYLGRAVPVSEYRTEDQDVFDYYDRLTAIGYGEPSFAALYANCRSVFGFHDAEALPNAEDPVTYTVFGWYAQPEQDFVKELLRDTPTDSLAALQERANWTVNAPAEALTADAAQLVCYSRFQFVGLGVRKDSVVNRLQQLIREHVGELDPAAADTPPPTGEDISGGAEALWEQLINEKWLIALPPDAYHPYQAILGARTARNELSRELKLKNDLSIDLDAEAVAQLLDELTNPSFQDSSVVIADTESEALSALLAHALKPFPLKEEKKKLEVELSELNARLQDLEEMVASGRIEEAAIQPLRDEQEKKKKQLFDKEEEIRDSLPDNAASRRKIEDQLETLFFTDELDARQLDIGPKVAEARLQARYNADTSGHLWTIRTEGDEEQDTRQLAENADLPPVLAEELAEMLDRLNSLQQHFEAQQFEIESARKRLFSDWYKYMLCSYPPEDGDQRYPDIDEVRYFIQQKDLLPLYELTLETGDLQLDHLTAPTTASATPGLQPDASLRAAIRTELDREFELPAESLAQRLAVDIKECIREISDQNIEQLKLKKRGGFDEVTDWPRLLRRLDTATEEGIVQLKASLGVSFAQQLDNARVEQYQITAAKKEQIRGALNAFLLEEINALRNLYLGLIDSPYLFLTRLVPADIKDWDELLARLQQTGAQNAAAALWQGLPEAVRSKLSGPLAGLTWSVTEQEAILAALHVWVAPRPEHRVRQRRVFLENLFPGSIHAADKTAFVLKRISAPRFWEPKEPALLIAGDIVKPSNRFGRDGRSDYRGWLECQLLPTPDAGTDYLLLPADFVPLAAWIAEWGTAAPAAAIGHHVMLANPWNPFQMEWEVELCPLLAGSNAADGEYSPDYLRDNYTLQVGAVEMTLRPGRGKATTGRSPNIYSGRSLLTTNASKSLDTRLKTFLYDDEEAVEQALAAGSWDNPYFTAHRALGILEGGLSVQSQLLSGFNQALLMYRQTLQLPIDDPIGFEDYRGFTRLVAALTGYTQKFAPQPLTDFSPIRTGELNLNQLRVVDTFGQFRQLDFFTPETGTTVLGTARQPSTTNGLDSTVSIPLTPRLAQPARLNFRWVNADDSGMPANGHEASSPVCGWLLANYADLSLLVFRADGTLLGAVEQEGAAATEIAQHPERSGWARWRSAVGQPSTDYATAITNAHLLTLVTFIRQHGPDFVRELTDVTDAVLRNIEPENFARQNATVLLMGRPLALVRAAIDLECKEIAAVQQSWEAFLRDRLRGKTDLTRETDGYTQVRIPVRIGAPAQFNDGLVAFWKTDAEGTLQENTVRVNGVAGDMPAKAGGENYHPSFDFLPDPAQLPSDKIADKVPIEVAADDGVGPQYLSLLIDPYAKVHAITGILPVKEIDLPAEHFERALQAISLTFLAGPILSPPEQIRAPLPHLAGQEWSWIERTPGGEGWERIRQSPTITKHRLTTAFAELLWQQLVAKQWVVAAEDGAFVRQPAAARKALNPAFASLQADLAALLAEQEGPLSPAAFTAQARLAGGVADVLWDVLTDAEHAGWLDPDPNASGLAVVRTAEERRSATLDQEVLGVSYRGLEPHIQELLRQHRRGIFDFSPQADWPEGRLWLREGWLQLTNSSQTA
jgi:hypothetical protein